MGSMAPTGHASRQAPQPTHSDTSTCATLFSTLTAPVGQTFSHFLQPRHVLAQASLAFLPTSVLRHRTNETRS